MDFSCQTLGTTKMPMKLLLYLDRKLFKSQLFVGLLNTQFGLQYMWAIAGADI